jgi:hypothetical protein
VVDAELETRVFPGSSHENTNETHPLPRGGTDLMTLSEVEFS